MKHAESNGPSLAELAAEANRRRHRFPEGNDMDTSQAGSLKNAPWWAQVGVQFGFGAVIALMLVIWLQTTVEKKIDAAVVASQEAELHPEGARYCTDRSGVGQVRPEAAGRNRPQPARMRGLPGDP